MAQTDDVSERGRRIACRRLPARFAAWVPRVVATALWSLILGAVVLASVAVVRSGEPSGTGPQPEPAVARWDVVGFAELFVAAFVGSGDGGEVVLAPFMGGVAPDSLVGTVAGDWFASSTSSVNLVGTGDDRWQVTVAATLLRRDATTDEYTGLGVRFFDVEVVASGSGLAASGLPWMVPAPAVGDPIDGGWGSGSVPAGGDGLADTVERFLGALLTGSGELGRYAAPGSGLRSAEATFDTVTLERMATREFAGGREVRAWVVGESDGVGLWLVYSLWLVEREGRWEVASIGPSPVVEESSEIPVRSGPSLVPGESE